MNKNNFEIYLSKRGIIYTIIAFILLISIIFILNIYNQKRAYKKYEQLKKQIYETQYNIALKPLVDEFYPENRKNIQKIWAFLKKIENETLSDEQYRLIILQKKKYYIINQDQYCKESKCYLKTLNTLDPKTDEIIQRMINKKTVSDKLMFSTLYLEGYKLQVSTIIPINNAKHQAFLYATLSWQD